MPLPARQVQIACDFVGRVSAWLARAEVPAFDACDQTFEDLQQRIAATPSFIGGLDAARIEGSGKRELVLCPGTPKERGTGGEAHMLAYGLPQLFLHVTTAYDLLRHNGVAIGKKDYMARTEARHRHKVPDAIRRCFVSHRCATGGPAANGYRG